MLCLVEEAGGVLGRAVSVNPDEKPWLVATQTLTFLFADIEGSASMAQRLGDAYAGVLADHHQLIRAGLAATPPRTSELWSPTPGRAGESDQRCCGR